MAAIFLAAITLGMIGSFHCIGMCGPLAFSLPLSSNSDFAKFAGSFLYNFGRMITYGLLGLLCGLAGKGLFLFGFQQGLSVTIGIIILLILFIPGRSGINIFTGHFTAKYTTSIRSILGRLFLNRNYPSVFAIGLLNGLLPCGLVYMAIAGAVAYGSPFKSAIFMASFGLGTLPVMWSVSFFGNYIGIGLRRKIRSVYPFLTGLIACLLIVRGLGLGIPYLSPSINVRSAKVEMCQPDPGYKRTVTK